MTDRTDLIRLLGPILRRVVVDEATGCWLWTGARTGDGYGHCKIGGRDFAVHRLILEACGLDLAGKVVHHRTDVCGRPHCLQPRHLLVLTNAEHVALHHRLRREAA